eukprot:CAMPEP_0117449632 /NCGR_PEP_ID=MMETSP0759-20121206/8044_1 /TAXON_ID=63605 /ORGANISM="Percolomonas cosmopolitus, Strain WS" /LENGTH=476 /DNA_ID=CAMNT_0005242111 /DNA_START=226 /DNA_END=1656 /DNA_ORIENTATION=-
MHFQRLYSTGSGPAGNQRQSKSGGQSSKRNQSLVIVAIAAAALAAAATWYTTNSDKQSHETPQECSGSQSQLNPLLVNAENLLEEHIKKAHNDEPPIIRICLTGGPSSGKTTSLAYLRDKLSGLGFQVFIVTEIATLLLLGGAKWYPGMDMDELLAFETALMKNQMAVEDSYIDIAKGSKKPTVILCDRGVLDCKAYMSDEVFEILMEKQGWNETKLREGRYDAVIHLITAAIGAESFYTRENNPARMESAEQAAELDLRLRDSYVGHPNFMIIDNSTHFEGKVERVYSYVGSIVGLPKNVAEKRKFLLKRDVNIEEFPPYLKYEIHQMTQSFLKEKDPEAQTRIRKRSQKGTHTYSMSTKRSSKDGKEETVSVRPISAKSYYELAEVLDPSLPPVTKRIKSFVSGEYYFELAKYQLSEDDTQNPVVLQVEAPHGRLQLPDFLKHLILKEVTPERETDDHYGSYRFSQMLNEQQEL